MIDISTLFSIDIKKINIAYKEFKIPKKKGGYRLISSPNSELMTLQRKIVDEILSLFSVSQYCHSYKKAHNIKTNSIYHLNQDLVLKVDIKNFFGSINEEHINNIFFKLGVDSSYISQLTNLCLFQSSLPQGAPTSPYLSNLVLYDFDKEMGKYCFHRKIKYTRYADDITLSGNFNVSEGIKQIENKLRKIGFQLNRNKTKVLRRGMRQLVTGVVVNEKLQVPKNNRKRFRQEAYYILKYGLDSHQEKCNINNSNYLESIIGYGEYILYINPKDKSSKEFLDKLKQYKKNQL